MSRARNLTAALCILIVLGSVFLLRPGTYLTNNHALQIPYVQITRDPSLYPNDAFARTLSNYCSLYWLAVAKLDCASTETTLAVLYALTAVGGVAAAAALARAMVPSSMLAPWVAAIFFGLGIRPFVGGGTIAPGYAEHTSLAVVFLVLAFAAALRKRPFLWAVAFALGFLTNQIYGVHVGVYFLIWGGIECAARRLDRRWVYAALLVAVLIAPALLWSRNTVSALELNAPGAERARAGVMREIGMAHFYPRASSPINHARLLLAMVVTLVVALRDDDKRRRALAIAAVGAAGFWIVVAFVLVYALPPGRALILHAMRGADAFCVVALVYLVSMLSLHYEGKRDSRQLPWLAVAGLAGILLLWDAGQTGLVGPLLILLAAVPFIHRRVLAGGDATRMRAFLCLAMLGLAAMHVAKLGWEGPILHRMGPSLDIREVASWARQHTERGDMFMINPGAPTEESAMFRPLATRSVFVTRKDGSAIHWDASYLGEFLTRMAALGMVSDLSAGRILNRAAQDRHWRQLSDATLLTVGRDYAVDYAVFDAERITDLPVVHRNGRYKVVAFREQ